MTARPWEAWTRIIAARGDMAERVRPLLSVRAIAALRRFATPEDVTIAKLYAMRGVGRKAVREIMVAFAEHGYEHMDREHEANAAHWTPEKIAVRRRAGADRVKARREAQEAALSVAASIVGTAPIDAMTLSPTVAQMQALQDALRKAGVL